MFQHPIYALLLSLMVIFILIENSIQRQKLLRLRLTLSFINTFLIGILWLCTTYIENELFTTVVNYIMLAEYILFAVIIFVICFEYLQKMKYYNNFIDSFKNTTFNVYYITDRKDRVKEISESFLSELGCKKEEIIGKNFFEFASGKVRFFRIDDTETSNDMLRNFYRAYPKTVNPNDETKREIYLYNKMGQTVILNLLEKPIFFHGKYKGRMNIGQKRDNNVLLAAEKELKNQNQALESVQHKFISTLELTSEGVYFYEIEKNYIWFNDNLVQILSLNQNTLSITDFHSFIHPDDFGVYKDTIDKLTPESPKYKVNYRFKAGYNYQYVTEVGKRIFEDKVNPTILAFVSKYENSYFAKTSYKHLDEIKSYDELVTDVNILRNNNMNFDLVTLRTTNLSAINDTHSRKIGDMILSEYIKQVRSSFVTDSSDIYRVTGTDFVFTITDGRKMDFLRRCIESGNEVMNFKMQYGNVSVVLEINMGIAQSYSDGNDAATLIANSKKALIVSLNTKYTSNYAFFKDIAHD